MTVRLYIVPNTRIETGIGKEFVAPKYFWGRMTEGLPELQGVRWAFERYAWENHGIVAADVTDAQHVIINALTDVIAIPALDNVIPNDTVRNRIRTILENGNIPGSWVNTGMTYRQVVRTVLNIFHFHARYVSKGGRITGAGLTLDTTWSEIPQAYQDRLRQTADEFELDYSWITGATTLRQILKGMADLFGDVQYQLGEMII